MRLALAVIVGAALAIAAPASASYTQAQLVSSSPSEQAATGASNASLSGDGHYVVFQSTARNLVPGLDSSPATGYNEGGIFRKDLVTGAVELVARGDRFDSSGNRTEIGARNPSVSADGEFVSFSTEAPLRASDSNGRIDVYVRDMAVPIDAPVGQFDLVSSPNLSPAATLYSGGATADAGSDVSARSSISADGRKVLFFTRAASNLPTGGAVAGVAQGQLLLRDRDQRTTTLVTVKRDSGTGLMTDVPAGGVDSLAALSGDGSTVVWSGGNAPDQTRYLQGEDEGPTLPQPLWRRVVDGPQAPTRRVLPAGDPDDPACPFDGVVTSAPVTGPCQGPMGANSTGLSLSVSADGMRVAAITNGSPRLSPPTSQDFVTNPSADLFAIDMSPGLSRKAGFRELTREGAFYGESDHTDVTAVADASISRDGRWVAAATSRTSFALPQPTQIGLPSAAYDLSISEIYAIDLQSDTIELVTRASNGGKPNGTSTSPTFSSAGERIAFRSAANNLFPDGTTASDIFVADRINEDGEPASEELPPPPDQVAVTSKRNLPVTVHSASGGRLLVDVLTPGAGMVRATALAGRRNTRLARGRKAAREARRVTVVLRPAKRFRTAMRRRGGLPARLRVSFAPRPAGSARPLRRSIDAVFKLGGKRR